MTDPLYLGFDVGGSKTVCLAGDRVAVLGRGEAGPANPNIAGIDGFRRAIVEASAAALGTAAPRRTTAAWIGVAGSERPAVQRQLREVATEALAADAIWISHDGRLLLAAAGLAQGIAVVAGTGSSVYGLAGDGREATAGGWGHLLGDEGSGYDIARRALRAVTQASDGRGPATLLSQAIVRALDAADVASLRERCYPAPPVGEVARLAAIVLELAAHDPVSSGIVRGAARELVAGIRACRSRLGLETGTVAVVPGGGLLGPGSPLLAQLEQRLAEVAAGGPDYRVVPARGEPASGALSLARDGHRGHAEEDVRIADTG